MKPNAGQEQLSVPEIAIGLGELEKFLGIDTAAGLSPLFPFKLACKVYEQQDQGQVGLELAYETRAFRECVMFVAAAMDLIRYFQAARHNSEIKKLRPHFDIIAEGFFGIAGTYGIQMSKGSRLRTLLAKRGIAQPTDAIAKDATRKSIELMVALAALNSFDGLDVEDPKTSDPDNPNPDLIIRDQGKRFGVACKSISSLHEETFKDNVAKGVCQLKHAIAAGKVDHRCGVVLLDVSALLDHDKLYVPEVSRRWTFEDSGAALRDAVATSLKIVFTSDPDRLFHDIVGPLFKGSALPPGVLIYAHGLMLCEKDGVTSPVYQKALHLRFGGDTSCLSRFSERLNRALHCQHPGLAQGGPHRGTEGLLPPH